MTAQVQIGLQSSLAETCEHPSSTYVGSGGSVTYRACDACGATLVAQGGRVWALPARRL